VKVIGKKFVSEKLSFQISNHGEHLYEKQSRASSALSYFSKL
jgi:hypothetical protein